MNREIVHDACMCREHAMMRISRRGAVAALLVATVAGCASSRGQRYQDRNMDFGAVRTVAVMPFVNLTRDNLASDRVRDVFSSMLLATGGVYVLPAGEVARGVARAALPAPASPSAEDVVKLGTTLKVDAVITGVVKEYGEVRSGSASSNVISMSVQLLETATGKVVWAGTTTRGGISMADRLFGGGGSPLNDVTEAAVDDVLNKMFK
jgi:hypothetical protein